MIHKLYISSQSFVIAGIILLTFLCANFQSSEIQVYPNLQVIVNKEIGVSQLTKSQFEKIIHGEQLRWPNVNKSIYLVFIETGQPINVDMCDKMFNFTTREFNKFWIKLEFEGKLTNSPEHFYYEEEVIKFVARTPEAIGVISSETKSDLVKTITITENQVNP